MKKIFLLVALLSGVGFLHAQYTQIPDPGFEQFLINEGYDDVMDGQVLTSNIAEVQELVINDPQPDITDLTGIEGFQLLQELGITLTGLVNLDLSANTNLRDFYCIFNLQLTHINFDGLNNLESAYIHNNNLISLDVSTNQELYDLFAYENQISDINLGDNLNLTRVLLFENQISSIDVTNILNLETLTLGFNLISNLDLTNNQSLEILDVNSNQLTSLDIRNGNNTLITDFIATNNPDLQCILVDDAAYSTANWPDIDATSTFVETEAACDALSLNDAVLNRDIKVFPNPAKSFFVLASPYHTIQNVVL